MSMDFFFYFSFNTIQFVYTEKSKWNVTLKKKKLFNVVWEEKIKRHFEESTANRQPLV